MIHKRGSMRLICYERAKDFIVLVSELIVDSIRRKRAGCFLWHLNRWQAIHGELALAKYMVRFPSIFYFFCGWGFHQFYIAYTRIWSPYLYKKRSCILLSSDGRMHVDAHTSTLPHLMHVRASFALGFFYFLLGFHFCVTSELDMLHTWAGILISSYKTSSVAADSIYLGFDRCIEHRPANQRASSELTWHTGGDDASRRMDYCNFSHGRRRPQSCCFDSVSLFSVYEPHTMDTRSRCLELNCTLFCWLDSF